MNTISRKRQFVVVSGQSVDHPSMREVPSSLLALGIPGPVGAMGRAGIALEKESVEDVFMMKADLGTSP